MSAPALFGVETEYAVTALDAHGGVLPLDEVVGRIRDRAAARPHLPGEESGIFLPNGGRFYIDVGNHPEYAAPETTNPWDAVRYSFAGDRLMAQLAREVAERDPAMACLAVRKGNVDYTAGSSWGSHENFLHRRSPAEVRPALISHLVSRVVFTGSGGLDPLGTSRPRFVLSPRAMHVRRLIDMSAPGAIALVDTRAQPHCVGFHRQHLMCGDANVSQLAMFLRIGTTALVLALVDAGCANAEAIALADPLQALGRVARDLTLRRPLDLVSGGRMTAVDIQRHFLRQARRHEARLPEWSGAVCDVWQDTLDRLARGSAAVADRLDWAIKHAIYRDRLVKAGEDEAALDDAAVDGEECRGLTASLGWRAELCEIDLRFGQVYPAGLFDALEEAGVLDHRVGGIDDIDQAVSTPPTHGRAGVRGRVIARLANRPAGISCGWDRVKDIVALKALDLSDPFGQAESWRELAAEHATPPLLDRLRYLVSRPESPASRLEVRDIAERLTALGARSRACLTGEHAMIVNSHAVDLRNAGRLDEAECLMRAALAIDMAVRHAVHPKIPHRRNNLGTVLLMQGRVAEAREQVRRAWLLTWGRHDVTSVRILTVRLLIALMTDEPHDVLLGQLKTHVGIRPLPNLADVDSYWRMLPVLEALAPRLSPEDVELVRAIVGVLNGEHPPETLDGWTRWRDARPFPLDAEWPTGGLARRW